MNSDVILAVHDGRVVGVVPNPSAYFLWQHSTTLTNRLVDGGDLLHARIADGANVIGMTYEEAIATAQPPIPPDVDTPIWEPMNGTPSRPTLTCNLMLGVVGLVGTAMLVGVLGLALAGLLSLVGMV